jgi:hypothetical protein
MYIIDTKNTKRTLNIQNDKKYTKWPQNMPTLVWDIFCLQIYYLATLLQSESKKEREKKKRNS